MYTSKTRHGVPEILSNYFRNKRRNFRDTSNCFKNKAWDLSNYFKKKTKGVTESFKLLLKPDIQGFQDSLKLPQEQNKRGPVILSNYLKNKTRNLGDLWNFLKNFEILSNYVLQKLGRGSPRFFQITSKTRQKISEILRTTSKTRPEILRTTSK